MGNLRIREKVNGIEDLRNLIGVPGGSIIDVQYYGSPNEPIDATYIKNYDTGEPDDGGGFIRGIDGFYKLISRTVTPYMFGAIQRSASTTPQLQRFFDYWMNETDTERIADFQGVWYADDTIIIEASGRVFNVGSIYYRGSGAVADIVQIKSNRSVYRGKFSVSGTSNETALTRGPFNGIGLNAGFSNATSTFLGITDTPPAVSGWTISTDLTKYRVFGSSTSSTTLSTVRLVQSDDKRKYVAFTTLKAPVNIGAYYEIEISKCTFGVGGEPDVDATVYRSPTSERNTFDDVSVSYVNGWAVDLRGDNIFNTFRTLYASKCGTSTGNRVYLTINSSVNYGSVNSVGQGTTLTMDSIHDQLEEKMPMEIEGRWHFIDSIDRAAGTMNIFPWIKPGLTYPYTTADVVIGGGVVAGGGDVAGIKFEGIDSLTSGTAARCGGLYGMSIGVMQNQNNRINLALGWSRDGNNIDTSVDMYYRENDASTIDIFQITRAENGYSQIKSTNVLTPYVVQSFPAASTNGTNLNSPIVTKCSFPMISDNTYRRYTTHNKRSPQGNGNYSTSDGVFSNLNSGYLGRTLANSRDYTTKWYESVNLATGMDSGFLFIQGTGPNGAPTGAVSISLGTEDATAGRTLNGGTSTIYAPTWRSGPLFVQYMYDYAASDWKVSFGNIQAEASVKTGSVISLESQSELYNMSSASSATSYVVGDNRMIGGTATCLINTATEPSVDVDYGGGFVTATKISGATWVANTDMEMRVTYDGNIVKYFFLER